MKKTYKFENIPFNLDFKKLSTERLLNVYRKVHATSQMLWDSGWCCEGKCYHYSDEDYADMSGDWSEEKYKKTKTFSKELKKELNKREDINNE